jgi:hypothetical protein
MSFDLHLRRFDPRWLSPGIEADGDQTSEAPDASPFFPDEELASDVTDQELDEALEQVALQRCCVCPLCGAIVGSDGSVLS